MASPENYRRPKDLERLAASWPRKALWAAETVGWEGYWGSFKALRPERASDFGATILGAASPLLSANRTARRNIALAFPDASEAERERIRKGTWRELGRIAGELPHLDTLTKLNPDAPIKVIGSDILHTLRERGHGAVFICIHKSNWELMPSVILAHGIPFDITYRAVNNPHIDAALLNARRASGVQEALPKGAGTPALFRALKAGRSIGLMNDQKFNQGLPSPLFGHDAMTAPGPTRLAQRFGVPLIPMAIRRTAPQRFEAEIFDPLPVPDASEGEAGLQKTLRRINTWVERQIQRDPDQWFWVHRRWPKEAWAKAGVLDA